MSIDKFKLSFKYQRLNSRHFDIIASNILNKSNLLINNVSHRIIEIEFYLNNANHSDPYVHCNSDQLLSHKYYFHKFSNGSYKNGTFKGLDIVFGDEDTDTYFGILIRSIMNIQTSQVIEGPCNVVNHILRLCEIASITSIREHEDIRISRNDLGLILKKAEPEDNVVYSGPRIGLSAKYLEYQSKPYRYVTHKHLIKKNKKSLAEI